MKEFDIIKNQAPAWILPGLFSFDSVKIGAITDVCRFRLIVRAYRMTSWHPYT